MNNLNELEFITATHLLYSRLTGESLKAPPPLAVESTHKLATALDHVQYNGCRLLIVLEVTRALEWNTV